MKFLNRSKVERELEKKFGKLQIGQIAFKSFESEYQSNEPIYEDERLLIIEKFLKNNNVSNMIFFPYGFGWQTLAKKEKLLPVKFKSADKTITFLEDNLEGYMDNYILEDKFNWIIKLCNEGDLHISGTKKFVDDFKKKYFVKRKSK